MLKAFHALPSEARAQNMKQRDYLWCLVHQLLDQEEELNRLCPACRARAEEKHCPVCGSSVEEWGEGAANPSFDQKRFEELKGGGGT